VRAAKNEGPGPGSYHLEKKKDDVKAKVLVDEAVKVPFSSGEERDWNKKKQKQVAPGPGSYIDINNPNNSSVGRQLLKYS